MSVYKAAKLAGPTLPNALHKALSIRACPGTPGLVRHLQPRPSNLDMNFDPRNLYLNCGTNYLP